MNPTTREQKNTIVKILNDADVDPTTGDCATPSRFHRDADPTFQRSSSRPHHCTSFLLPISCAKISKSLRKTLTSRLRAHSLAR